MAQELVKEKGFTFLDAFFTAQTSENILMKAGFENLSANQG